MPNDFLLPFRKVHGGATDEVGIPLNENRLYVCFVTVALGKRRLVRSFGHVTSWLNDRFVFQSCSLALQSPSFVTNCSMDIHLRNSSYVG